MTQDLINGFQQFKHFHYNIETDLKPDWAQGQDPKYFIISCIDSRCNPGTVFRAKPGIFLSHKAMGAIVRPYKQGTALSAALQFALKYNDIDAIIVLGHTQCGAIKALAEEIDDPEISSFVSVAQHGLQKAKACHHDHDDIIAQTEQETILESTENLKHYPSVAAALKDKKIIIKSWQFDLQAGDLREYDAAKKTFIRINTQNNLTENRKTL